jgi:hypothetical protein
VAPSGGTGYGAEAGAPGDRRTGDAALRNLVERDPFTECSGLRAWQRALDRHYRRPA